MADKNKKKIATFNILGGILPVVGTVALLGLWLYQQTSVEQRADDLRKVESARNVYQTYQSHNAVFNAIHEGMQDKPQLADNVRRFQVYNYELGLRAIEDVLSNEEKKGIPAAPNVYSSTENFSDQMAVTQKRLELLQGRLDAREKQVHASADSANAINLWLYVVFSLVSVAGAVCQIAGMKLEAAHEPANAARRP
ncbi:MAG TPA: hypothetical protein VKH81_10505 [Candidatus Angelobacter sp.]|nr:hypothetical protein [Candidatus Angelobacter sp.]